MPYQTTPRRRDGPPKPDHHPLGGMATSAWDFARHAFDASARRGRTDGLRVGPHSVQEALLVPCRVVARRAASHLSPLCGAGTRWVPAPPAGAQHPEAAIMV